MSHSVAVIGTIFMDCKGFAAENYEGSSRNLGSIRFVHGGVGRNVAENLANLEVSTTFVSTVDDSAIGQEVIARLKRSNVETRDVMTAKSGGMGMWLAILDEHGNLAGSISQMPELQLLSNLLQTQGRAIIQQASHIVLELDLNDQISQHIMQLAQQLNKPVYGIPGNLDVVMKQPSLLDGLACFICNHHEAGKLFKTELDELAPDAILALLIPYVDASRLKSMVVTLGAQGSVFYSSITKQSGFQPVFPVQMVDSSGAGDAFFSGTVMGLIRGFTLPESVICGTKVAGWTIASAENTCLTLQQHTAEDTYFQNLRVK